MKTSQAIAAIAALSTGVSCAVVQPRQFDLPVLDLVPLAKDTIAGCKVQYPTTEIDNCDTVAAFWGLSTAQFITYNPSLGLDCSNLKLGQAYCVRVEKEPATLVKPTAPKGKPAPGPTYNGAANCQQWQKIFPGDVADKQGVCKGLSTLWNLGKDGLKKLNPGLDDKCSNLKVGNYLCVNIPTTTRFTDA